MIRIISEDLRRSHFLNIICRHQVIIKNNYIIIIIISSQKFTYAIYIYIYYLKIILTRS